MKPFRLYPLFLFLFLFLFSISTVKAESTVDISVIPQNLADQLGIPLFAGQLLCSAILILIFVLPTAILTRRRGSSWLIELILGFLLLGVCIALTWLPYWFLLLIALIVAGMYAVKMKGVLGT